MSLEERLEQAEKLVAEVKAELAAMRATKRNWPERIEAGMVFQLAADTGRFDCGAGHAYIAAMHKGGLRLTDLQTGERRSDADELFGADGDKNFTYIGHARDILTIRTEAHEPTGAELVGRVCEFSDDGETWHLLGSTPERQKAWSTLEKIIPGENRFFASDTSTWKLARLAR